MNISEPGRKRAIKHWSEEDRPREKLKNKGKHTLSNTELLAILIGTGTRNLSAIDLARKVLEYTGNDLNTLSGMSIKELTSIEGIGEAKAVSIAAAIELGGRRQMAEVKQKTRITGSLDVFKYFAPHMADLHHEEMWLLMLNRANRIIGEMRISEGGVSGTVADPRKIFKAALDKQACSIIIAHNHPSGNNQPSEADRKLTGKIAEAARFMEISFLDHLIICQGSYFSFADEGLL